MQQRGASLDTIAGELQRQPSAIRSRLRRRLGGDVPESRRLSIRQGTPSTAQHTLDLHREGLTIEEIATQRGFKARTIAEHLARLVEQGEIESIRAWVSDAELARVRRLTEGRPVTALRPLYEALDGSLSYDQLQIARAYLHREFADSQEAQLPTR